MGIPMNFGAEPVAPHQPAYVPAPAPDPRELVLPVDHPRPVHFYHLHAGADAWLPVAAGHFQALRDAEFWGEVHVGLVGSSVRRQEARAWLDRAWPGWIKADEADAGYEQVTLDVLHQYAQRIPLNTPVLYCHTKGAWRRGRRQDVWRGCMTRQCVALWRGCAAVLDEGYDTAGAHWMTPKVLAEQGYSGGGGYYGGNFWWATAGYLAGLPPVSRESRFHAEGWVGQDCPKYKDLAPGWIEHASGQACVDWTR